MKRMILVGLGILTLTFGCSSQQQEQMQEGVDGQQQESAQDGQENFDGQQALENGQQAADFNEDMAENGEMQGEMAEQEGVDNLNLNEAEGEIPENGLAAQENGLDAPEEQPADMANTGSNVADLGEEPMQGNMDAPMAGGDMAAAPTGNGARVYYVTTSNTPVMSEPSESSQKVNVMSQGDFTLLWVNGEWGKTQTGLYIPMKYMSSKGIARPKAQSAWR